MRVMIIEILEGKNKACQHDTHKVHAAKQRGYIMETPTGHLTVTIEGMEFNRAS